MAKVEFHPDAQTEVEDIQSWYRARSHLAARAFITDLIQLIRQIAKSPLSGTPTRENERRLLLKRFPFSIVYRIKRR
jgi:plasmid stabilization system protein ParE